LPDALAPFTPFNANVRDGLGDELGVAAAEADGDGVGLDVAACGALPQAAANSAVTTAIAVSARLTFGASSDHRSRATRAGYWTAPRVRPPLGVLQAG